MGVRHDCAYCRRCDHHCCCACGCGYTFLLRVAVDAIAIVLIAGCEHPSWPRHSSHSSHSSHLCPLCHSWLSLFVLIVCYQGWALSPHAATCWQLHLRRSAMICHAAMTQAPPSARRDARLQQPANATRPTRLPSAARVRSPVTSPLARLARHAWHGTPGHGTFGTARLTRHSWHGTVGTARLARYS